MKLFATVVASATSQGFYDYSLFNNYGAPQASYGGKYGNVVGNTDTGNKKGLRSGNGRYCHATKDNIVIHRWDVSKTGFFNHYNRIECQGEEMYCFLEERAHFGQVIGIRAGCAQMMNHPQIKRTRLGSQQSYNNNREAFRKRTFTNNQGDLGSARSSTVLGYGVGGCMAMQVQNHKDQLDNTFDGNVGGDKEDNMFFYGSWYQAQCLRKVDRGTTAGWNDLLPFGVSVCRACCVAGLDAETNYNAENKAPCNFLPFKQPANGSDKNERPHIPFGYDFACQEGYTQGVKVDALTHEYIENATKDGIMTQSAFSAAAPKDNGNTCGSTCNPNRAGDTLADVAGLQEAAGGITYHSPSATPSKIRHFACNDFFSYTRGYGDLITKDENDNPHPGHTHYAKSDAEWYNTAPDGICDGTVGGQKECFPKTFEESARLIGDPSVATNAFDFNNHTWVDNSDCDICQNELVPRFDAVNYDSANIVNLFAAACNSTLTRCDPVPKTVVDMQLLFN